MKLVRQILVPLFISFTIATLIIEIGIYIGIELSFKIPFKTSINKQNESSIIALNNYVNSFTLLSQRRLSKYLTQLLLIGLHLSFSVNDTNSNTVKPKIKKDSKLYQSYFEDCFILGNTIENLVNQEKEINDYINKTTGKIEYLEYLTEHFKKNTYEEVSQKMFQFEAFKKVSYYISNNTSIDQIDEEIKHSICYAISIMKVLYITNSFAEEDKFVFHHLYMIYENLFFMYPPDFYKDSFAYSTDAFYFKKSCFEDDESKINFPSCLGINNLFLDGNKILVSYPQPFLGSVILSICSKVPIKADNTAVLCGDIKLINLFKNFFYSGNNLLQVIFLNFERLGGMKVIHPFYINIPDLNKTVFDLEILESLRIKDSSDELQLFHMLYYDVFSNFKEITSSMLTEIFEEYSSTIDEIIKASDKLEEKIFNEQITNGTEIFSINKTFPYTSLIHYNQKLVKGTFKVIMKPVLFNGGTVNDFFILENSPDVDPMILCYSLTIEKFSSDFTLKRINTILSYKNTRILIFFIFVSFFLEIFAYEISLFLIGFLLGVIKKIKKTFNHQLFFEEKFEEFLDIKKDSEEEAIKYEKLFLEERSGKNYEMRLIEKDFLLMKKTLVVQKILKTNELVKYKHLLTKFIEIIEDKSIKEKASLMLAHLNIKKENFSLSRTSLQKLLPKKKELSILEKDDELKDMIKRFSESSYINEFSQFKINESMLSAVHSRITKQRILYLYAITLYNEAIEKEKIIDFRRMVSEALNYFVIARNIIHSLGINPIKEIFCVIMIARCHISLKDFKAAKNKLNEGLILFNELHKLFKDIHSKNYLSKPMLFIMNYIFQSIMNLIGHCLYESKRYSFGLFVLLNVFNSSIYLHKNIHQEASYLICKVLEELNKNNQSRNSDFNQIEGETSSKRKKKLSKGIKTIFRKKYLLYSKIHSRLSAKVNSEEYLTSGNYCFKKKINRKKTLRYSENSFGIRSLFTNTMIKFNQHLMIIISENTMNNLDGKELIDVIIKNLQKNYPPNNEGQRFSYLQFNSTGKRAISFHKLYLNQMIQKLISQRNNIQVSEEEEGNINKNRQFTELFNILEICLKNISNEREDNIILLFIQAKDIRFNSEEECKEIVKKLNENNFTVIFCCCDCVIDGGKIRNITYFINGLAEGYFFHIKNYQILKQIFFNFGVNQKQENFFEFDYESVSNFI